MISQFSNCGVFINAIKDGGMPR